MQRVLQPCWVSSFLNIKVGEIFWTWVDFSLFQTNLFLCKRPKLWKIECIRNLSTGRDFKITVRKNWRAVNVQESKSDGARPMKNASDEGGGRYTVAIRCVRSGLDMETDQGRRKEVVEGPREWYWSRIECEETAVADSVPGGFLLRCARVWRNFARNIGTFEREVARKRGLLEFW